MKKDTIGNIFTVFLFAIVSAYFTHIFISELTYLEIHMQNEEILGELNNRVK